MSAQSVLEAVNMVTHGRLEKRLVELRETEGLSYELMAERVRNEFNISCSTGSVYRWWNALERTPA